LDKIVNIHNLTEPAEILNALNKEVNLSLRQEETGDDNGMDAIALNVKKVSEENFEIKFAGAKRNLVFVTPDNELTVLKGTKSSIGGMRNHQQTFAQTIISLPAKTALYLFSDGYADQNTPETNRIGSKDFINLINSVALQDMSENKRLLEENILKILDKIEQRDDILVLGTRL
jgi:serine phosphatase RsbU (regulator of sigma subunit)